MPVVNIAYLKIQSPVMVQKIDQSVVYLKELE